MTITLDKVTTEMFKALMKKEGKYDSKKYLSDLFVQLESLLTTTFNPLTTLLTTNFLKPWQSLAISGRTFSSGISRSQRFWQLLATPEYKRKRRGSDTE